LYNMALNRQIVDLLESYGMSSQKPLVIDLENSSEYQPLLAGRPQTCGMRAGRVFLKNGQDCGQHCTKDHEEMLIFLRGAGQAILQGHQNLNVGKGKIVYIPPHTVHNIRNTGDKALVYIYCVTPVNQK